MDGVLRYLILLKAGGDSGQDKVMDIHSMLFGDQPAGFAAEVAIRSVLMFLVVLFGMRVLGKRGVKELSVFELVIILGLGSAAGDPMFYKEVGIVNALVVFTVILCLYRLVIYAIDRSKGFERLIKGKPVYIINEGRIVIDNFRNEPIVHDELFSELRIQGISHLGQIRTAIMETSGDLSLFPFEDEDVRYGLPILPEPLTKKSVVITEADTYACTYCGHTEQLQPTHHYRCPQCQHEFWVKAACSRRVT